MSKVLIVLPGMYFGGMERVSFIARELLLKNGYDVDYVTLYRGDPDYIPDFEYTSLNCEISKSKMGKIVTTIKRIIKLRTHINNTDPDVLITYGKNANFIAAFAKTHQRLIMGIRSYDWLYEYFYNYRIERYTYNKADLVVSVSRVIQAEAEKRFEIPASKSRFLYNPYDINKLNSLAREQITEIVIPPERHVIVSAGRLENQKAFYHLIKACSLVKSDIVVYIMGHGSQKDKLQKLIEDLCLGNKVFLIGGQSNPYKFMARADLYVLTSITEGFPNALVEAMTVGTAVIAADCMSGPREILSEDSLEKRTKGIEYAKYGVLVQEMKDTRDYNYNNIEECERYIAEAIEHLLKDNELRAEYSNKGKERIKEFSYNAFEKKLMDFVETEKE